MLPVQGKIPISRFTQRDHRGMMLRNTETDLALPLSESESGEGFLRCCYATDIELIKQAMVGFRAFLAETKG